MFPILYTYKQMSHFLISCQLKMYHAFIRVQIIIQPFMTQTCLPQIDIRLDGLNKRPKAIIHCPNKLTHRKSLQRYDWVKRAILQPNQNVDDFVRISFTNKTTLFKRRRLTSIQNCNKSSMAPLEADQVKKAVIINQPARVQTEGRLSNIGECKILANGKKRRRRKYLMVFGNKLEGEDSKRYRYNRSLIELDSLNNNTSMKNKTEHDQFKICPWNDKQNETEKQNKYGRYF